MAAIGVIGSGTWGTALSLLLCKNGCEVTVWSAIEEEITEMKEKRSCLLYTSDAADE